MIQRILEIMPVQRIDNYNNNRQSSRDNMKRQGDLSFGAILEKKINQAKGTSEPPKNAYQIDLGKRL